MSKKAILAVWRPGSGAQWWRTGMSINEFKAQDADYFDKGLRLASIDIFRYSDIPQQFSYTAVWRPGSGAQYWQSGMSVSTFKTVDAKHFKEGRRIVHFDIQNDRVFAVWRDGSGPQYWATGMSASRMKSEDAKHVKDGLRLVALKKHGGNDFAAVWRPGTGTQWWKSGMSGADFKLLDAQHFANGLHLHCLDTYAGKFMAVWRPGNGGQRVNWGMTIDDARSKDLDAFKNGLRLTIAKAKHDVRASTSTAEPPSSNSCKVWATAVNGTCYNLDGSTSTILTPGTLSASACGPTLETARENAKRELGTQMCFTTKDERKPGCCTVTFQ